MSMRSPIKSGLIENGDVVTMLIMSTRFGESARHSV